MTIRAVNETGYTGTETSVVFHGRQSPGGTPVILCHGVLSTSRQFFGDEGRVNRELADLYEVTSGAGDLGGLSTWGNDASIDAVTALITHMGSSFGTKTDRVAIYGTSMGALTALNWAMRNVSAVVALGLTAPAVALQGIHDRDPIGLAELIELAYTDEAGYLAALPTHDPSHIANRDAIRTLGPRTRVQYSTDDNVIDPAEVLAYAGWTGCLVDNMGAIGHSATSAALSAMAQWLDGFCS